METNNFESARNYLNNSYEIYLKFHDKITEESILMLNNLGVVCTNLNDLSSAEDYLNKALEYAKEIPNLIEIGVIQANLGIVYLKKGLINKAKDICGLAWRLGKQHENETVLQQANYCIEQLKII